MSVPTIDYPEPTDATYPWRTRAARDVAASVGHRWQVTLDEGGQNIPAEVVSAVVTFDEGWSPHVQAALTLRVPDDADTLAVLDPRQNCRIGISAGYVYPDAAPNFVGLLDDVHQLASLTLTRRNVRRPQDDLILTAMSEETRAQAAYWYEPDLPSAVVDSAATAISQLVAAATGQWPVVDAGDPVWDVGKTDSPWNPADYLPDVVVGSTSYWSLIESVADTWDLWVYDDAGLDRDGAPGNGWRIKTRPTRAANSAAAQLRTGEGGNLIDSDAVLSAEDGWANSVHLAHDWTDADGDRHAWSVRRSVTSGPMSVYDVGFHSLLVQRQTPITHPNADKAARSLVRRTVTRGRSYTLTAPAMYWVRPGDTVTVQLPTGGQERHLVVNAAFSYPDGRMTLSTRLPESVTTQGAD